VIFPAAAVAAGKKHRSTEMICLLALTLYLFYGKWNRFCFPPTRFCCWPPLCFWQREKTQEKE